MTPSKKVRGIYDIHEYKDMLFLPSLPCLIDCYCANCHGYSVLLKSNKCEIKENNVVGDVGATHK